MLDSLHEYHGPRWGRWSRNTRASFDQFSGDGIMVFNDPVPCPDPAERAVKMAVAMQARGLHALALAGNIATDKSIFGAANALAHVPTFGALVEDVIRDIGAGAF